ncbi:MAG: hypothetical protein ACRKGH_07890 [Dehalogenimonas sp.]
MERNNQTSKNLKRTAAQLHQKQLQQLSGDAPSLPTLLATLGEKSTARFKAVKELQLISKTNPSLLYPHFQVFTQLLDNPSRVLLWNGIIILSYLVKVDTERHFDGIFYKYYAHLWDGNLVTSANILGHSGHIILSRPDLSDKIVAELLSVDSIPLPTTECREVARGSVLASFTECYHLLRNNQTVNDFIIRCAKSHRPAVKKQAEFLLKLTTNINHNVYPT